MKQHIEESETESLAMRVKKLADNQPIISTGMEYDGLYELNNKSAENKLLRSIDEIKRPFASKESSVNGEQASDVLSECKDSANRTKYQIYLDIFEMQPIFDRRSEIRD